MPRTSATLLAAVLLALFACVGTSDAALKRGSRGPAVAKVQRWLGLRSDGVFGPTTRRAVRRFQHRHGLTADGVVGPATWRALRRSHTARRSASGRGLSRRALVRRLQRSVGVTADGVFGPATARAVRRFQRRHGLAVDGVAGPATWAGARASRNDHGAEAAGRDPPPRLRPGDRPPDHRGGEPHRPHAIQVRRRARAVERHGI
jgi:peptidoglycan hydrolase-like protein with peptidoglycan-binding domain